MGRRTIVHFELELPSAAYDFAQSASPGRLTTNVPTASGGILHVCVPADAEIRYVESAEDGVYADQDGGVWKRVEGVWLILESFGSDRKFSRTDYSDDVVAGFGARRIDQIENAGE